MTLETLDLEKEIGKHQAAVLDSSFTLTGIVSWERAVSLVVAEDAYIVIPRADGTLVRSRYLTLPRPLAVAIHRYVGAREREVNPKDAASKTTVLMRDNWTCYVCGGYGDTVDHLLPKSRGGLSTYGNLATACFTCNGAKGDRTPEEMGWEWPVIPKTVVSRRRAAIQDAIYKRLAAK